MDYTEYSEEDFILDESFIKWVKKKADADYLFWESWLAAHPEKRDVVDNAARFITGLTVQESVFSDEESEEEWQSVRTRIQPPANIRSLRYTSSWRAFAAVSAATLLIALAAWIIFGHYSGDTTYATRYGETRTIRLPDSSRVILNANSSLRFASRWTPHTPREVWLDGEAYLDVKSRPGMPNSRFIVHSGHVDVEVLGTSFNVNNRRGKIQVVLSSGKVKLNNYRPDRTDSIFMEPGELVELSVANAFTKKKVNPERYTSWHQNKLLLNDISIREISQLLEDTYGLTVTVADTSLNGRKLSGELAADDPEVLLDVIAETLDIRISRNGKHIILEQK